MSKKEFNSLEEIKKYYDKESNTYIFKEDNKYIDSVIFNFDLNVDANIEVNDIHAQNIKVRNIIANNIDALDISYYAVCFADQNIKCKSIKGRIEKATHFVLDGKLEVDKNVS